MAINIVQPEALALPAPRLPGSKIGHRLLGPAAKFAVRRGVSDPELCFPTPLSHTPFCSTFYDKLQGLTGLRPLEGALFSVSAAAIIAFIFILHSLDCKEGFSPKGTKLLDRFLHSLLIQSKPHACQPSFAPDLQFLAPNWGGSRNDRFGEDVWKTKQGHSESLCQQNRNPSWTGLCLFLSVFS